MRNNNIILILATFFGLTFFGVNSNASDDPQDYKKVLEICSQTSSPLLQQCAYSVEAFKLIKDEASIFTNFKENKFEAGCGKAQSVVFYICRANPGTTPTVQNQQSGTPNDPVDTANAVKGAYCDENGKHSITKQPCMRGQSENKVTNQPQPSPVKVSTTVGADGKTTYVTVDRGDGTSYTEVKDEKGNVVNKIETKSNGKSKVTDSTGEKIKGDDKKAILTEKEAAEKAKLEEAKKAEVAANEKTKELNDPDKEKSLTEQQKKDLAVAEAAKKAALSDLKTLMNAVVTEVASAAASTNTAAQCGTMTTTSNDAFDKLQDIEKQEIICKRSSGVAGFICPKANSPAVLTAATLMNAGSAIIPSIGSAKDTCKYTSQINLAGQLLLTAGAATCIYTKERCENKCEDSNKKLESLKQLVKLISESGCSATASRVLEGVNLHVTENTNTINICKGHKGDAEKMTVTALNMMGAVAQAKACESKLSALEGTNNTAQLLSMDEMCSQAQNASSTLCRCRTDNTAVGCPGYLAGAGNEGNINKDLNANGVSAMAGLSYGTKINPAAGTSGLDMSLDGLSDDAKKALAAGGDQESGSMFGASGGASAGGGGGTAAGAGGASGADKGKIAEESKSFGSSFMNAVGSLFKGGSGGKAGSTKDDKIAADKYKEQIKRQIAAEQLRSEISSASGMDNWTKIRSRYKSNANSLIDSN